MIYLDHAAATPLSTKAKQAMEPYFSDHFFNPSSPYLPANQVRQDYETAKNTIAHAIGAKGIDLIMTSGATEANNLAFSAIQPQTTPNNPPAILISAVEHPSIIAIAQKTAPYDTIAVDPTGRIDLADLQAKITPHTQLVSICLASSELGTIQPLTQTANFIKFERQRRLKNHDKTPIYLHCDASQGIGLLDVKVARLGVDLLTLNSAKIYGPKGIGALWISHQVKLNPLIAGGGQENGLRSGTENVPAVMGFAAAITEVVKHTNSQRKRLVHLRDLLRTELSANSRIQFLGNPKTQLANFLTIAIPGLDAERLIFKLEQQQVYLATGAACAAAKGIKSPTLQAIGLSDAAIAGSLRVTLGKLNTETNIKQAAKLILAAIAAEQERIYDQK